MVPNSKSVEYDISTLGKAAADVSPFKLTTEKSAKLFAESDCEWLDGVVDTFFFCDRPYILTELTHRYGAQRNSYQVERRVRR